MKRYKFLIIFGLSLITLSSCVNDLDTQPLTKNILTPELAWQDPASYSEFLAKIYASFSLSGNEGPAGLSDMVAGDQGEATFLRSYWNLQQLGTDEVMGAWDNETLRGLQFNQWNSSNDFILLNYNRIYLNVAYANEFLRQTIDAKLAERGVSPELVIEIKSMRAQARVLRAMSYYFLMDLYGNVPYIPEEAGVGSYLPEQKDPAFFFNFIENELREVEPDLPAYTAANYGKVTVPASWMLLTKLYMNAQVYIQQDKYTDALTYINKIIGAGYSLEPQYKNLFNADNNLSKEIIYSLVYDGLRATTYGGMTFLLAASYKSDMNPLDNFGFSQAWSGIRSKETLSDKFIGNDDRAMFWKTDRTKETTQWGDFNQGWSVIKFSNKKKDGTNGSSGVFADTDFPMYRLGDVYLLYAEAVLRGGSGGDLGQALIYVNKLRDRSNASLIGSSDLNLNFLLDERSRELYWEGHRRTDLIRFGKFTKEYNWPWKNGVYSGTPNISEKYKWYPLPATEISANPNLTQNPGY